MKLSKNGNKARSKEGNIYPLSGGDVSLVSDQDTIHILSSVLINLPHPVPNSVSRMPCIRVKLPNISKARLI